MSKQRARAPAPAKAKATETKEEEEEKEQEQEVEVEAEKEVAITETKPPKKKKATAAVPTAAAAATKKAKTKEVDEERDEEVESDRDDDEEEEEDKASPAAVAAADQVTEAELAERKRRMRKLLQRQRRDLAILYTPDKCKVREIPATAFAKNGIQASTMCTVCENAIMGACKACFLIQDGEEVYAVHDSCFVCSHYKDEEHVCGVAPFVVNLDATGNNDEEDAAGRQLECYVDRGSGAGGSGRPPQPVCMDHIDLRNLQLPKYDVDDVKHMLQFFNAHGFVIVKVCPMLCSLSSPSCLTSREQSGAAPGFWEDKAAWINRVLGMMVGWTEEQRLHYMGAQGWDFHFRDLPGFKQHCLGVTGNIKGSRNKYAADVVQSKEAWDARAAVFPIALPFFSGNKPTVMAGMAPLFVLAHYTALQTQTLQFFPSETRQTNEREDSSKPGRAKAIEIVNGMVMAAPCRDISIIVCPLAWETRAGPTTFDREWKNIEQRQEAGGAYHADHWAEDLTTPLSLDTGDLLLFKGARPFRITSGTANCTGFFLNWQTGVPKSVTMTVRADAVTEGVVLKKNSNMGYRYVNNKASTNADIPRDFGTLVTPVTVHTVGQYAGMIFGTNYEDQKQWPKKYQLYASSGHRPKGGMIRGREEQDGAGASDDDDLDIRVITEAEAKTKGKPAVTVKGKKTAAAAPPAKKAAAAVEKKKPAAPPTKKAAPPVVVEEEEAEEQQQQEDAEDALEPMDVDGDEAAGSGEGEAPAAPAKKAPAKKQKPTAKSTPASVFGEPYVDAKDALEACTRAELPVALHFAPDWLPEDETRLPSYWSTLWSVRERKVDPEENDVFYAGDVFPRGSVVVFKDGAPRVELFDAFADLDLGCIEEDLRAQVYDMLARERRIIKVGGKELRLSRAVESFGADVRVGNDLFNKTAETPDFVVTLLEHMQERNLIVPITNDNGNMGIVHRVSMIAIQTRAEGINPFSLKVHLIGSSIDHLVVNIPVERSRSSPTTARASSSAWVAWDDPSSSAAWHPRLRPRRTSTRAASWGVSRPTRAWASGCLATSLITRPLKSWAWLDPTARTRTGPCFLPLPWLCSSCPPSC